VENPVYMAAESSKGEKDGDEKILAVFSVDSRREQ
jgi:hypothetical protein